MLEVFEILLPVGILMACAYGIGYMSGSQATKEIYDPKIRQSDLDKLRKLQYNIVMSIITPNKFAIIVEDIVRKKRVSYIDAIVLYCTENHIDPSTTKSMINKNLKEKIAYEAQSLNMLKEKTAKLPIQKGYNMTGGEIALVVFATLWIVGVLSE